jgi:hypothetical protein
MNGNGIDASDTMTAGQFEKDFVQALQDMTVASEPLAQFKTIDCSPTAFPVFALTSQVSETALQDAANSFNDQAQAELGFSDEEFAEMGVAARVPESWQLQGRSPMGAAQWFLDDFDKRGEGTARKPQWFPYALIGIMTTDWRDNGVVVVFFKDHPALMEGEALPIVAFVASPEKVGSMINTLRQHNDHIDNVREDDEMV